MLRMFRSIPLQFRSRNEPRSTKVFLWDKSLNTLRAHKLRVERTQNGLECTSVGEDVEQETLRT